MSGGIRTALLRRRLIVAGAAAAALTMLVMYAVPATAGKHSYQGPIFDTQAKVEFELVRKEGKLYAMHFHVDDLPYACPDGSGDTVNFGIRRMRVRARRFSGSNSFGAGWRRREFAEVVGRLRPDGEAKGTVYYEDRFDSVSICETGELAWSAHR